jgi:hypothetical protein
MFQFQHLRVRQQPVKVAPDPHEFSVAQLIGDFSFPISIRGINGLPEGAKRRIYRLLIPPIVLTHANIHPITWKGTDGREQVELTADQDQGLVNLSIKDSPDSSEIFFCVELADNAFNGIDLNLLLLNDPSSERFRTDYDEQGKQTMFGTLSRNLKAEEQAMRAGLAPGQIRSSLGASQALFQQIDAFLAFLGHHALSLEPLTYASAWVFERRGFAYMRGHQLMDDIQREFQPGGKLNAALDASTPFRQPDQWRTVRGRAWAIHDGILKVLDTRWNDLRMVKQVGRNANVNTFPDAVY